MSVLLANGAQHRSQKSARLAENERRQKVGPKNAVFAEKRGLRRKPIRNTLENPRERDVGIWEKIEKLRKTETRAAANRTPRGKMLQCKKFLPRALLGVQS
jgi:hypothetical protein